MRINMRFFVLIDINALPHHSCVYLEEVKCVNCCPTSWNVKTKVSGLVLLVYLFYNLEQDIHSFNFYKKINDPP